MSDQTGKIIHCSIHFGAGSESERALALLRAAVRQAEESAEKREWWLRFIGSAAGTMARHLGEDVAEEILLVAARMINDRRCYRGKRH